MLLAAGVTVVHSTRLNETAHSSARNSSVSRVEPRREEHHLFNLEGIHIYETLEDATLFIDRQRLIATVPELQVDFSADADAVPSSSPAEPRSSLRRIFD